MNTAHQSATSEEIVTRTKRWIRIDQPREGWWPWGILPLAGLLLLALFAFTYFASEEIESAVERRAKHKLEQSGYGWARVQADGQEVMIRGTSPKPVSTTLLADITRATRCDTFFGPQTCPTEVRVEIDEPPPPAAPAKAPATVAAAKPAASAPVSLGPARQHDFTFEVLGEEIVLRGEVPSEVERKRLVEAAQAAFKRVVDKLRVTNAGATAMYSRASKSALEVLAMLISGKAAWLKGKFGIAGVVAEGRDADVRRLLRGFSGPQLGEVQLLREKEASTCDDDFATILKKSKIQFATGSAQIRPASMGILRELAAIAKRCPVTLQIEGHTDNVGQPEFNEGLSQRRAQAVGQALNQMGIDQTQLVPIGFGQRKPRADNTTASGRAQNRRIEVRIRR